MFFLDEENKITEKQLQILYQTHPYLIEKKFLNQEIISQYPLASGLADIVIFLENEVVVIELKVEPLDVGHLLQLRGYLEDIKNEIKNKKKLRGILIGKTPKYDLINAIYNLNFEVKIMLLERDVCTKVKICEKCRLANDFKSSICLYCTNNSFL